MRTRFKKKISFIMLVMIMMTAVTGAVPAFAADAKTAEPATAKISFNGVVKDVQTYNIDGYNYVKARDITDALGMQVAPIENGLETGIMITSWMDSEPSAKTEKLTKSSAAEVKVFKGMIYYNGVGVEANMFVLNDRYFFKLTDIQTASDKNYKDCAELNSIRAKGNIASKGVSDFERINIVWDKESSIVKITTVRTNFQKLFNEIRNK